MGRIFEFERPVNNLNGPSEWTEYIKIERHLGYSSRAEKAGKNLTADNHINGLILRLKYF
jgi:hypothetical protein